MAAPKNCDYILLAEFDIDEGSTLRHEYPARTGCNVHLLAELMLPDGVHQRTEDWTVFYLNQTKATTIKPELLAEENGDRDSGIQGNNQLLYTMSLVRTKHGSAYKRGALVKALAVCSRHPFIQIFRPVLLLALEDYFNDPSVAVLKQLYDSINNIDISSAPRLSIFEKLILRNSERKDMFEEKFESIYDETVESNSSLQPAMLAQDSGSVNTTMPRSGAIGGRGVKPIDASSTTIDSTPRHATEEADQQASKLLNAPNGATSRQRSAPDSSTASTIPSQSAPAMLRNASQFSTTSSAATARMRSLRDTHFHDTEIMYNDIRLPIRLPLSTFDDEVGEYSLINLVQAFSNFTSTLGPLHSHLHTNGSLTPPIIVLFNALLTYKRVVFLGGTNQPASVVSNFVLSAAALASGCGLFFGNTVQRRTFAYSNLTNLEFVETIPGFIAGVNNPRFLDLTSTWDVLCNIETGRIHISKDIQNSAGASSMSNFSYSNASSLSLSTSSTATHSSSQQPSYHAGDSSVDLSPEPMSAVSGNMPFGLQGNGVRSLASSTSALRDDGETSSKTSAVVGKMEQRVDSGDNLFMDDIVSAVQAHFGESVIRAKFVEYMRRFLRLASRFEEETFGQTNIDFPTTSYDASARRLGSGLIFPNTAADDIRRELSCNSGRVESWRRTPAYEEYKSNWINREQTSGRGSTQWSHIDLVHQIGRLKNSKKMPVDEVEAILRMLQDFVHSEENIVELLSHLPSHSGGLLPITFGLFHPSPAARAFTVDFLDTLVAHPTGLKFVQTLNAFHKLAYSRLAEEKALERQQRHRKGSSSSLKLVPSEKDRQSPLPPIPSRA